MAGKEEGVGPSGNWSQFVEEATGETCSTLLGSLGLEFVLSSHFRFWCVELWITLSARVTLEPLVFSLENPSTILSYYKNGHVYGSVSRMVWCAPSPQLQNKIYLRIFFFSPVFLFFLRFCRAVHMLDKYSPS